MTVLDSILGDANYLYAKYYLLYKCRCWNDKILLEQLLEYNRYVRWLKRQISYINVGQLHVELLFCH